MRCTDGSSFAPCVAPRDPDVRRWTMINEQPGVVAPSRTFDIRDGPDGASDNASRNGVEPSSAVRAISRPSSEGLPIEPVLSPDQRLAAPIDQNLAIGAEVQASDRECEERIELYRLVIEKDCWPANAQPDAPKRYALMGDRASATKHCKQREQLLKNGPSIASAEETLNMFTQTLEGQCVQLTVLCL